MSDRHRVRVTDATHALSRRRRPGRRRRGRLVAGALVGALLLVALAWMFLWSPGFRVEQVRVVGAGWLKPDIVVAAAQVPIGEPMATVSLEPIADRVAALGPIRQVTVRRAWPHTVVIEVELRTISIQRRGADGYQWVDATGVAFWVTPTPQAGVIQVASPTADQRLLADAGVVAAALTAQLRAKTAVIHLTSPDNIVVELTTGQRVEWGSATDSPSKAQVATVLLGTKARVINVSAPGRPMTR